MSDKILLTPARLVDLLDRHIIGQRKAKVALAIAFRNRWRRMNTPSAIKAEIKPSNMMIIGPTGRGKTECARRFAKITDAPFVKVEASGFTERGYVGGDAEGMVKALVEQAFIMEKKGHQAQVRAKAEQAVEERILELVIPSSGRTDRERKAEEEEVNTTTVPQEAEQSPEEPLGNVRELFRKKIRQGELDHRQVEVILREQSPSMGLGLMGNGTIDEGMVWQLQGMLKNLFPKPRKKRKITIAEAKAIFLQEETEKLIDLEKVKQGALRKAAQEGIIFIDEIDKIATSKGMDHRGVDVSRGGVQRDLLPIVEGTIVETKYGPVHTEHVLFIAAGAFHQAEVTGLIPELRGRFPIRVEMDHLTEHDFLRILTETEYSLIKKQKALFEAEGVTLSFTKESLEMIAKAAFKINQEQEDVGVRRLETVINRLLERYLFQMPDVLKPGKQVTVTPALVAEQLDSFMQAESIQHYIL